MGDKYSSKAISKLIFPSIIVLFISLVIGASLIDGELNFKNPIEEYDQTIERLKKFECQNAKVKNSSNSCEEFLSLVQVIENPVFKWGYFIFAFSICILVSLLLRVSVSFVLVTFGMGVLFLFMNPVFIFSFALGSSVIDMLVGSSFLSNYVSFFGGFFFFWYFPPLWIKSLAVAPVLPILWVCISTLLFLLFYPVRVYIFNFFSRSITRAVEYDKGPLIFIVANIIILVAILAATQKLIF